MAEQRKGTILYVDDDEANRRALTWVFEAAGFDVREAATGSEALRLAGEKPDLVVLDVNLPDINGFEVCRRIKMHPGTSSIPVLHLSACYVASQDKVHGLDCGADGYLTKPVEPQELVAQAQALMRVHEAEKRARNVARQWQATFDAISDGVCLFDAEGRVVRCNLALARLLRLPVGEIVGRMCHELTHQEVLPPEGCAALQRMLASRARETAELTWRERRLLVTADPILEEDATLTGAVYIVSDITERKRLEDHLKHAQKMEAIGQLAGGIAHDFNNLLTVITGSTSLLLSGLPAEDPSREFLLTIDRAAWRAAEMTSRLLGFARRSMLWLKPTDLDGSVQEVVGFLRRTIDPRITVEVHTPPDLWRVRADHGQMHQVLMNLCLNARDAMPEGGRLVLEMENVVLDEATAHETPEARPGEYVRLRVRDTGHGIPPDVQPHIFEPYYTTKEQGKGTGLGLAMVFGIIEQHQGWIAFTSSSDEGTCFEIFLPRLMAAAAPAPASAPEPASTRGKETVLFVDDEVMLRNLGRRLLMAEGYEVLLAEDGQEALEVYARDRERIDLVVLDLTMPRLSGRDTFRELLRLNPHVPVVFASGYSAEKVGDLEAQGALGFVQKPYVQQDLAQAVRSALDRVRDQEPVKQ